MTMRGERQADSEPVRLAGRRERTGTAWKTGVVGLSELVVVMGVSGSGKSTVGKLLADRFGVGFLDADDVHSPEAIDQMHRGVPLTAAQRDEWIDRLVKRLHARRPGVLACSALARRHRDRLRSVGEVSIVLLEVPDDVLTRRLRSRRGHFFDPGLLAEQLSALERPGAYEDVSTLDGTRDPDYLVDRIRAMLHSDPEVTRPRQ